MAGFGSELAGHVGFHLREIVRDGHVERPHLVEQHAQAQVDLMTVFDIAFHLVQQQRQGGPQLFAVHDELLGTGMARPATVSSYLPYVY